MQRFILLSYVRVAIILLAAFALVFGFSKVSFANPVPTPFQVTFPATSDDREITDTTALIGGYFITGAGASGAVSLDVHVGTTPQAMNIAVPAVFANPAVQANHSYPFVLSFSDLIPGTTYYFYATETVQGENYPVQQFTTTGTAPPGNTIPLPSNSTLSNAFNISFPSSEQVITETSVTLSGHIVALAQVSVHLGITYGISPSLMLTTGNVYSNPSMESGSQATFTYTMANLTPGTGYYFQFRDLDRNTDSELLYVKTKGGTGGGNGAQFGALVVGDGSGVIPSGPGVVLDDPFEDQGLVPCATTRNKEMCGFKDFIKLIGNVIDYALILLIPATAAVAVYAGVSFIVSRGDPAKLKVAKARLVKVAIAAAVIMLAWSFVYGIYKALIPEDQLSKYILLDGLDTGGN